MKAKIETHDTDKPPYWTWMLVAKNFLIVGGYCYDKQKNALSAARRVAKQLNLTVEE